MASKPTRLPKYDTCCHSIAFRSTRFHSVIPPSRLAVTQSRCQITFVGTSLFWVSNQACFDGGTSTKPR
jgi:hypothetical protein